MNRTLQQNKSLHLWLEMLADELNGAGYEMGDGKLIRLPILYTKENLKAQIVKPMMNALYPEIDSTAQLETTQLQELYKHIDQVVSERTGVHVEFPSIESLSEAQR